MGTSTAETQVDDPVVIYLGNRDSIEVLDDPDDLEAAAAEERAPAKIRSKLPGKRCTTIVLAPGLSLMEAAYDITHTARGVWQAHSDAPAPAWVASTWPALAQLLSDHWSCEMRQPDPTDGAADAADIGEEG